MTRLLLWPCLCIALLATVAASAAQPRQTENVFLVMTDGLRWQEVYSGAEESLLTENPGGVKDVAEEEPPTSESPQGQESTG